MDMYNRPGQVVAVIFSLMAIILTYKISTRETFEVPESEIASREAHKVSREDYEAGREARKPTFPLTFPLACSLGEDCWVARYMDRGVGENHTDFTCSTSTQNGHKGTDFVIADLARMDEGVQVLAAASGKVKRLRNGMADISVEGASVGNVEGKECGNAVIIEHIGGWQTQYCHLKRGSLKVKRGQNVNAGDPIGEIGLSGQTEYPHLHFMVRHNKENIDPFDGGAFKEGCDNQKDSLWRQHIAYQPTLLLPIQFSATPRTMTNMWKAGAKTLMADSPALLLTGRAFHARAGDVWHFTIKDPDGNTFFDAEKPIEKDRQVSLQYMGKKRPVGGFKPGTWTGEIKVTRVGADPEVHLVQTTSVEIRP